MKLAWVAVVSLAVVGCKQADSGTASGPPRPAKGKERGDCIAPKATPEQPVDEYAVGTCDPGLLCLSNLCVRPPPADCQAIAEQLTSFDLGNYAEPEERAPVAEKYGKACRKAMVSKEQGECIAKATDRFSAFQCAPLMFPDLGKPATGGGSECEQITTVLKKFVAKSLNGAQDPQTTRMVDAMLSAMKDSCDQDGWPPVVKQCILAAGENTDAMTACNSQFPPDVQKKLADRMTNALAPNQPSGVPTP